MGIHSQITLDKNVPLPPNAVGGRAPKYPFAAMEVGDSFEVAGKSTSGMSATANGHGVRHGKKFICRKTPDGVRIWRTA